MNLVEPEDLLPHSKGFVAHWLARTVMSFSGIDRANALCEKVRHSPTCAADALKIIDLKYRISDKCRSNIPWSGPLIVVSNHPTGMPDGLLLLSLLLSVRKDVKFLSNRMMTRVEALREYFIDVDVFDSDASVNMRGLKQAMQHLSGGGVLVVFPAGEVSTWQHGMRKVEDCRWHTAALKFINHSQVPVLPVAIDARNSLLFHLAGKIHPRLRTLLLPHEIFNKRGKVIDIYVGSAITAYRLRGLNDLEQYGNYLRAMVDYLNYGKEHAAADRLLDRCDRQVDLSDIVQRPSEQLLNNELDMLRNDDSLLFTHATYEVFCTAPERIPNMMIEIGRMREITFRRIGEGTTNAIDTDDFDPHYRQLFIWDRAENALVGAYRLGMGDEVIREYGLDGLYTHSLFKYSDSMIPILNHTIELGRSFVTSAYQRKAVSLMLLWKGIVYVLLKNAHYRYLLGPVTISGEFNMASKAIIVGYLQQRHFDPQLAAQVTPIIGLDGIDADIDLELIRGVDSIDLINKIVSDIEDDRMGVPVLIKKYLQLNSHVLGFNVDHDFCDALDALMLLDLKNIPEETIVMLSKEMSDIDVIGRFKNVD